MAYIGRDIRTGAFRQLDDISSGFDGSDTTHTMQVNSTNVSVGDVNQILLSLGGVIQKPGTDFTVSGSTLTFTTAPAANTNFFAILLGSDNGGTVTPTDVSVTKAKLADEVDIFAGTSLSAADLGAGVHIKTGDSGASVDASADELVIEGSGNAGMTIASGASNNGIIYFADSGSTYDGYINYSQNDRAMTLATAQTAALKIDANGHVNQPLQPAFRVSNGTQNDVAVNSNVTIIFSSEIYDKNSDFNTGTYTFTAPVTGRYLFAVTIVALNVDSAISYAQAKLVTSNHTTKIQTLESGADHFNEDAAYYQFHNTVIEEMDANDTAYVQIRIQGGAAQTDIDSDSNTGTLFHGYLLG